MSHTALLFVWLATGEPAVAKMDAARCHRVAAEVAAGKRFLADIDGEQRQELIKRAECREVQPQTPTS